MNRLVVLVTTIICQAGHISLETLKTSRLEELFVAREFAICFLFECRVSRTDLALFFGLTPLEIDRAILTTHLGVSLDGSRGRQYTEFKGKMIVMVNRFVAAMAPNNKEAQ